MASTFLARPTLLSILFLVASGCSSDPAAPEPEQAGSGGNTSAAGSGGSSGGSGTDKAELRFLNATGKSWQSHIAAGKAGVSGFSYTITFGSTPISVKFRLDDLEDGQLTEYQAVDGATYRDQNVLHTWYFNYNRSGGSGYVGGSENKQEFGRFGTDLTLVAGARHTVELGEAGTTLVTD